MKLSENEANHESAKFNYPLSSSSDSLTYTIYQIGKVVHLIMTKFMTQCPPRVAGNETKLRDR